MPPFALTQSKYAFAMFGMSVKSVPGCLVAMAPSLIVEPFAALPVPSPHTLCVAVCLPDPIGAACEPVPAPVAIAAVARSATGSASAMAALRSFILPPFLELSIAEQVCAPWRLGGARADESPDEPQSFTVGSLSASVVGARAGPGMIAW